MRDDTGYKLAICERGKKRKWRQALCYESFARVAWFWWRDQPTERAPQNNRDVVDGHTDGNAWGGGVHARVRDRGLELHSNAEPMLSALSWTWNVVNLPEPLLSRNT
jgi:hypothetical protein